ncbi:hypothetical protein M3664_26260 [Paenibacillus lautus]|uniref:hypothetical protein n=1 Tax=Paenibacillus TaxID=44249 RepID=UPI00119F8F72|nr:MULTISPECIES: hypothetical protein [Paenibacillus]MCM3261296.1 hypothetical protein [Paenibacillus lautus]
MMTRVRARLAGTNQGGNAETRLRPYRGRGFFVFFGMPETPKGGGAVDRSTTWVGQGKIMGRERDESC